MKTLLQHVIEDRPQETELITRHLQVALVLLFENADKHIFFSMIWGVTQIDKNVSKFSARSNLISHNRASISDDEKTITLRPDALINIVHGAALDRR